ncbi:hypothetical protein ACJJTC_018500 [Scirpophaga incertulas]
MVQWNTTLDYLPFLRLTPFTSVTHGVLACPITSVVYLDQHPVSARALFHCTISGVLGTMSITISESLPVVQHSSPNIPNQEFKSNPAQPVIVPQTSRFGRIIKPINRLDL